jgi:hypothetical protein
MIRALLLAVFEWTCATVMAVSIVTGVISDGLFFGLAIVALGLGAATRALALSRCASDRLDRDYRRRSAAIGGAP